LKFCLSAGRNVGIAIAASLMVARIFNIRAVSPVRSRPH